MSLFPSSLRSEWSPTLRLAVPVVLGQVGIVLMSTVDTAMVGRIGPEAVASVGVGSAFYAVAFLAGLGLLLGLDRLVSWSVGAGRREESGRTLVQGLYIATGVSLPISAGLWLLAGNLGAVGIDPASAPAADAYLRALSFSLWPSLLFSALRQTLLAMDDAIAANAILVTANLVNVAANLIFVFGWGGFPPLGAEGAGWATLVSRIFMLVALSIHAARVGLWPPLREWTPDLTLIDRLLRLGAPAATHMVFEVGMFSMATLLVTRLGAQAVAAHHVVLTVATITFMVPMGVSAAGAVRVGQALGREDEAGAARAGWAAVALGTGFMAAAAMVLVLASTPIARLFTPDPEVISAAKVLLLCAALFQFFDGAQVTLAGVLRGAGDTRSAMYANFVGHWVLGLPVGYVLCFHAEWGAPGLWIGLAIGLASVAILLVRVWHRRIGFPVAVPARTAGSWETSSFDWANKEEPRLRR